MVVVSLFKGLDCICIYAMPKRFGRGKERLAGFAGYFYTIDIIVYVLCIFLKEESFVQYLLLKGKYGKASRLYPRGLSIQLWLHSALTPVHFY